MSHTRIDGQCSCKPQLPPLAASKGALSQAIATITGSMETEREGPVDCIMDTATLDECRIYGANLSETYAFNESALHTTHNEHCMDLRL